MKESRFHFLFLMLFLLSGCGVENDTSKTVSIETGNLILNESHGDNGTAWGLPDCSACHTMEAIHQGADKIRNIVKRKGYSTCTGCHGRNDTYESEERQCTICHNKTDLPQSPKLEGQHAHTFTADDSSSPKDAQCISCHLASDMDGNFELNRDLTGYTDENQTLSSYNTISEFCLRCHNRDHQQTGFEIIPRSYDDPLVAVEDAFYFIDQHGLVEGSGTRTYAGLRPGYSYPSVVACTDCHAMHGTDNKKLIIDSSHKGVSQLDASLQTPAHSVTVSDGDYSQLCVLCHQMEVVLDDGNLDTGNGLAGVHAVGSDCRTCHTHGEAVQAGL